jgi:hypothetical protein
MTGQSTLVDKPGRTRRYHVPPDAARTIAALLTLRDQVIAPIIAGVRSPRMGRKAMTWTPVDRDLRRGGYYSPPAPSPTPKPPTCYSRQFLPGNVRVFLGHDECLYDALRGHVLQGCLRRG